MGDVAGLATMKALGMAGRERNIGQGIFRAVYL